MPDRNAITRRLEAIESRRGDDTVRQISALIDELSALAAGGSEEPPQSLEELLNNES